MKKTEPIQITVKQLQDWLEQQPDERKFDLQNPRKCLSYCYAEDHVKNNCPNDGIYSGYAIFNSAYIHYYNTSVRACVYQRFINPVEWRRFLIAVHHNRKAVYTAFTLRKIMKKIMDCSDQESADNLAHDYKSYALSPKYID